MPNLIKIKRGTGVPSSLEVGELAVDTSNGNVYIGTSGGVELVNSSGGSVYSEVNDGASLAALTPTVGDEALRRDNGRLYKYVSDGVDSYWLDSGAGGGVSVSAPVESFTPSVFGADLTADYDLTGTAYLDIPNWNTIVTDADYSFNTTTGELTFLNAGLYKVGYNTVTFQYSGNGRTMSYTQLVLDGVLVNGSRLSIYNRQLSEGEGATSADIYINVTANQVLKLQARNSNTLYLNRVLTDATFLRAERIR